MKKKALGSALVIAVMTPSVSASLPQKRGSRKGQQSRVAVQSKDSQKRLAIEKTVIAIIIDELGVKESEVKPNARFIDDLGADSLDTVELVMRIEEEFSIEIPDEDAERIQVVKDAYDYLDRRVTSWPKPRRTKSSK